MPGVHNVGVDLRLLRTFELVAETGSVTAAADVAVITQPALSRQLQQLERELGVRLFDRDRGRLQLTAAGRTFLEATRNVLAAAESARSLAASLAAGRLARVRVAAPTTTLTDVLAPFLATLQGSDPVVTVEEANHVEAIAALRTRLDLAIVTSAPPRHLSRRKIAVLPVWAYVRDDHPLAGRTEVPLEAVAEHRLILLDPRFRPRQLVDEALADAGLPTPEVLECSNPQVAQALAAAGLGVAVVSDDPRFGMSPAHIVAPKGRLTLTLHAAWDPQHHAAAELDLLAGRLSEFCAARYGA
jgi:DNA-binding transcriptional LysR family regulator